jgi:arylsulfatase A-like enzyme
LGIRVSNFPPDSSSNILSADFLRRIYMKRREFNTLAVSVGGFLALRGMAPDAASAQTGKKPNILFMMTDQQHARMMSCAGNPWLKTPAMDSLASGGMRFERAYCSNPVCVPSRTSMATGVMSCRLGADSNGSGMRIRRLPPEVDAHSMGKLMKGAGYDTFYGGKVHMCKSLTPRNAGYDEYFKDQRSELPVACVDFIKRKRTRPFFAVASFINPHDICFAHRARNGINTQGVLELHRTASSLPPDKLPPLPENHAIQQNEPTAIEAHLSPKAVTPAITMRKEYDEKAWRINRWIYHRLTEKVDRQIGRILDGLKEAGLEDSTLIVFTSDHGNMDASHRLASKGLFYEESVGVPLILTYKGVIPAGETDRTHLVSTGLDILPTVCDYAGIPKPEHLLGHSLRPLAEGKRVERWRTYVASENGYTRMIRSQRYKYCAFDDASSKESLVDMENDPGEMRNLVDDPRLRDVLVEHRRLLAEWSKTSRDDDASKYVRSD